MGFHSFSLSATHFGSTFSVMVFFLLSIKTSLEVLNNSLRILYKLGFESFNSRAKRTIISFLVVYKFIVGVLVNIQYC